MNGFSPDRIKEEYLISTASEQWWNLFYLCGIACDRPACASAWTGPRTGRTQKASPRCGSFTRDTNTHEFCLSHTTTALLMDYFYTCGASWAQNSGWIWPDSRGTHKASCPCASYDAASGPFWSWATFRSRSRCTAGCSVRGPDVQQRRRRSVESVPVQYGGTTIACEFRTGRTCLWWRTTSFFRLKVFSQWSQGKSLSELWTCFSWIFRLLWLAKVCWQVSQR